MVKYITYLFYKYYSVGPQKGYSYFSAVIAMMVLVLLTAFLFFGFVSILFPSIRAAFLSVRISKVAEIGIASAIGLILYFLLSYLNKEEDIKNYDTGSAPYSFNLAPIVSYILICFLGIVIIALKYFKK
jgi:hypothetical protein